MDSDVMSDFISEAENDSEDYAPVPVCSKGQSCEYGTAGELLYYNLLTVTPP